MRHESIRLKGNFRKAEVGHADGLRWVMLETTLTEIVASIVEAGLGIAVALLLPSGAVTRGRRIAVVALDAPHTPHSLGGSTLDDGRR